MAKAAADQLRGELLMSATSERFVLETSKVCFASCESFQGAHAFSQTGYSSLHSQSIVAPYKQQAKMAGIA